MEDTYSFNFDDEVKTMLKLRGTLKFYKVDFVRMTWS